MDLNNAYFHYLGISDDETGKEKLKQALKTAHDIRKFEIEMYWKRSAYLWTLQAAAFAGIAVLFASYTPYDPSCSFVRSALKLCTNDLVPFIGMGAVWAFGLVTAFAWVLVLEGAKYWQNNWERHVDMLEDEVTGALYRTYLVKDNKAIFSVSKVNLFMAWSTLVIWIALAPIFMGIIFGVNCALYTVMFEVFLAPLIWLFHLNLTMGDSGELVTHPPRKSKDGTQIWAVKYRKRLPVAVADD